MTSIFACLWVIITDLQALKIKVTDQGQGIVYKVWKCGRSVLDPWSRAVFFWLHWSLHQRWRWLHIMHGMVSTPQCLPAGVRTARACDWRSPWLGNPRPSRSRSHFTGYGPWWHWTTCIWSQPSQCTVRHARQRCVPPWTAERVITNCQTSTTCSL